ncbi:hypothetical protein BC835DRAFT_691327 [Cytidiella melzeri]|nr:hypothetical protein BC835DRAFT_691327 [Cytidiella melzeri]
MDAVRVATHPLLTDPILYLADPPKRIQWTHLEEVFSPCGTIFNAGKSSVHGNSKRKKWIVRFHTVFLAEMALATLQGAVVANSGPPWTMVISHSPTLEPALPTHRIFPQFVKTYGTAGHIGDESPQTVFRWFRRAGPLVSVRTNVNVGYPERVIVVEYWNEDDANWARMEKNALHEGMQHRPAFILRTYDPCSLYCAGMGAGCTDDDLVDAFIEFGHFRE